MFDSIIIGSGPAGLSAALTLKARNKSFMWFGNKSLSLKVEKAEGIMNYPGLINVSGKEMQEIFLKQIKEAGLVITEKQVTGVYQMGDHYSILCNQEMFDTKTVILTTGVSATKEIPGEKEYLGRGVSYCATCDGNFYKGKEIGIVIQDESYMEEVEYLKELVSKIYLVPQFKFTSNDSKIEVCPTRLLELKKEGKKIQMVFKDASKEVDGVFFLKNAVAPSVLVPGIEVEENHIKVNRKQETNMPGLYAAGDCTGTPYQYAKAVGEGNVAAHEVTKYLSK